MTRYPLKSAKFSSPAAVKSRRSFSISPEDSQLFRESMLDLGVIPLAADDHVLFNPVPRAPIPRQRHADEREALLESLSAPLGLQDRLEGGDEPFYLRHGVKKSVLFDLRRARWSVQAQIDLHGYTRDEAREELNFFIAQCRHAGIRCVRVIHGRGLSSPNRQSVLRQLTRGWLMQMESVLAYCQARPQDGGEGALITLLRTSSGSGKSKRHEQRQSAATQKLGEFWRQQQ